MCYSRRVTLRGGLQSLLVAVVLLGAQRLCGQFAVVSTTPADGATNVGRESTIVLTFNAPIDTSARFPWLNDFFLGLMLSPDTLIGEPDSIVVSLDLKTVQLFNLHLRPDTRYVFGILAARSTTGQLLDRPAVITFSTGPALPTASVSGTIACPGGDPTGTMVALFSHLFGEEPQALGVVSSSTGTYNLNYVPGGTYWPMALKDVDRSGYLDPEPGVDLIALYDPNGDDFPDSLVVPEGGAVSGINMTLAPLLPMTARQRYPQVQSAAQDWAADAHLVFTVTVTEISPAGESGFWAHVFYSRSLRRYHMLAATSAFLAPVPFDWEEPPDTTALPENWVDSDVAADSAEAHGGSAFRATHSDAAVAAGLGNIELPGAAFLFRMSADSHHPLLGLRPQISIQRAFSARQPWSAEPSHGQGTSPVLGKGSLPQSVRPAWLFSYSSESTGDYLVVFLDAVTGQFLWSWPWALKATTAQANLDGANQAARTWASDAQLVMVGTLDDLSPTGEAAVWLYVYYSASLDSAQGFAFSNGVLLAQMASEPPSTVALPDSWIDSGTTIAVVETHGGAAYRATQQNVHVQAWLSRGFYPWDPERAVWTFIYSSSTAPALTFWVDALTGDLLTDVDAKPETSAIPKNYALNQNYPNPFNPETVIEYQLPCASDVEISIFDLQGQKVVTLRKGHHAAGSYKVIWDGKDRSGRAVASGVYLYTLRTRDFVKTRKLVIIR
mgnify:CR=1 FL=1